MNLVELKQKIEDKSARIGVIGLGYVGLPVACLFAEAGFKVTGVDIKNERVAKINAGISPIEGKEPGLAELLASVIASGNLKATTNYEELRDCDVFLIDVETPVDEDHIPRYKALNNVCRSLGPVLKNGALVIVESTVSPGTTNNLVRPGLEASSGKRAGKDLYVGVCPERVMPGKLLFNLRNLSRVCGGEPPEVSEVMIKLYRHIIPKADLDPADCVTAELVKTVENAYRDVNIAFANEVALICEAVGADVLRVRELVNKCPGRDMLMPGAGVGGHCLPKDPWLLAYGAQGRVPVKLIAAARTVNDFMPLHMVELLKEALVEAGKEITGSRILVLGYAYLENSDDTRNSPSAVLVDELRRLGAEVVIHDPWVPGYQGDIKTLAKNCDAAVVMVAHDFYKEAELSHLEIPVWIDGRRIIDIEEFRRQGLICRSIGQN